MFGNGRNAPVFVVIKIQTSLPYTWFALFFESRTQCLASHPFYTKKVAMKSVIFPQPLLRTRANPLPTFKDSASREQNQTHDEAQHPANSSRTGKGPNTKVHRVHACIIFAPGEPRCPKPKTEDGPGPRTRWGRPKILPQQKTKNGEPHATASGPCRSSQTIP